MRWPVAVAATVAAVVALALGTLVVPGPATAGASEQGAAASSAAVELPRDIGWRPCDDSNLAYYDMECASVAVPLDYRQPTGKHIALALSRVVHTVPDSQYQGVMLVNPGGPGGSGLTLAVIGRSVPNGAGAAYDWIGFDPRGVGSSSPQFSCDPYYFAEQRPDYIPATAASANAWLARSRAFAVACARDQPDLLPHMTTVDSAEDVDSIRKALGIDQINFYGFSYGTYLAQVYATVYPQRVRRMVLDSNVDPRQSWYQLGFDQDLAFERNMRIWFGWLAEYNSVYDLGATAADVQKLFYREQADLAAHPVDGVGSDEWSDIFVQAGYYQSTWRDLGTAFAAWVHHADAAPLAEQYQTTDRPGDDNSYAVFNAVECSDMPSPTDWTQFSRDNWSSYRSAPLVTWNFAWNSGPCLFWPVKPGKPIVVDGSKAPPVLLIDETLDAATPFAGSVEVRNRFPRSVLIAEPGGTTHAGSLTGDRCVDDQVAGYLADGTLPVRKPGPGPDAICAPLPAPDPTLPPLAVEAIAGERPTLIGPDNLMNFLARP